MSKPFWEEIPASPPLLRPANVAEQTALSLSTIYSMIAEGAFPPFITVGKRSSGLPKAWLDEFIVQRAISSKAVAQRRAKE